jgi:hypothetical protein
MNSLELSQHGVQLSLGHVTRIPQKGSSVEFEKMLPASILHPICFLAMSDDLLQGYGLSYKLRHFIAAAVPCA